MFAWHWTGYGNRIPAPDTINQDLPFPSPELKMNYGCGSER